MTAQQAAAIFAPVTPSPDFDALTACLHIGGLLAVVALITVAINVAFNR